MIVLKRQIYIHKIIFCNKFSRAIYAYIGEIGIRITTSKNNLKYLKKFRETLKKLWPLIIQIEIYQVFFVYSIINKAFVDLYLYGSQTSILERLQLEILGSSYTKLYKMFSTRWSTKNKNKNKMNIHWWSILPLRQQNMVVHLN